MEKMVSQLPASPTNHMEVEGELCKFFYRRFGQEALPIIEAVFYKWGLVLGERMKAKLPNTDLKTAIQAYIKPVLDREPKPELIELSDERAELKVFTCPYRLDNAGAALCKAMMAMDRAIIETLMGQGVKLEIRCSLANGDGYCLARYRNSDRDTGKGR